MDIQPDRTCNFGKIVAVLPFAAGACGPVDGTYGSPTRESYKEAVKNWIDRGVLPKAAQRRCGY
jgi:hypothetical protein